VGDLTPYILMGSLHSVWCTVMLMVASDLLLRQSKAISIIALLSV